jgi:hypothetical protein
VPAKISKIAMKNVKFKDAGHHTLTGYQKNTFFELTDHLVTN